MERVVRASPENVKQVLIALVFLGQQLARKFILNAYIKYLN